MTDLHETSRRGFLGHLAGAAALPVAAGAALGLTPRERLDNAVKELQAAAKACYPEIADWTVGIGNSRKCPLVIAAYDWTGNDGWVKPSDREATT